MTTSSSSRKSTISINGVTIETNKGSVVGNGSKVRFGDGSWYNIATREFHDGGGPGYVKVNGRDVKDSGATSSDESDEVITKSGEMINARDLSLDISTANVTVHTHDEIGINYKITGPKSMVDGVTTRLRGTTADISENGSSGSVSFISIGNGSFSSSSLSRDNLNALIIEVFVPKGTAIDAETSGIGDITIGDVCGTLDAESSGTAKIRVGRVAGDVTLSVSGTGSITVKNGVIDKLHVDVSGVGNVSVGCTSQTAKLKVSGVGSIDVDHVVNEPIRKKSGIGNIRVRRVG